ncbi:SGS-domain-containing protein [Delitschia confertaspora ATCC 74209]|uniref:SGS-domain-containing protein n=1 Tax=Delitschia confertaspora ATCC 74209 TaxID=1513339 RepID=A0A9P4JGA3_9PLEO|nr:SGS-domain-containing protein [Delitschia confertaspora ATCC 74209]
MDQAARGAAALKADNFSEAIKYYTEAISILPTACDYYIKRSTAYQRSSPPDPDKALSDAEIAVVLAHKRGKRELIKDAQFRRAVALFHRERYADAQYLFGLVEKIDEKDKMVPIWKIKVANKLKGLAEDDEKRNVTVKEVPEVDLPKVSTSKAPSASSTSTSTLTSAALKSAPVAKDSATITPTTANKIKHDWYQNSENVYFTLLAKGVPKDQTTVEIEKDSLSIAFPIEDSSNYDFSLDPLFAPIDPSSSSFKITPTKVEVVLKKETSGVKWRSLEGDREVEKANKGKQPVPREILDPQPPAYPTSSRSGAKDWDKLAKELVVNKAEDGDDNYDLDEGDGDETTRFFRQLYKGAAPEQQRAMMKSFSESGGTVLSTDWSNVGNRTVVPEPPEGMEAKKYGA